MDPLVTRIEVSAERHGLDPQKYLMSMLAKIGQTKQSEIDQFLPDKWEAEDEEPSNAAF